MFAFLDQIKLKPCYNLVVTALEAERLIGAANILKKHTNYSNNSTVGSEDSTDQKNERLKSLIVGDPGTRIWLKPSFFIIFILYSSLISMFSRL